MRQVGFWGLPMNLTLLSLRLSFSISVLPVDLFHSVSLFLLSLPFLFSITFSWSLSVLSDTILSSHAIGGLWSYGGGRSVTGPEQMSSGHDKDSCVDEKEWGGCLHRGFSSLHTYFSHPFRLPIMRLTLQLLFHPTFSRALVFPVLFLSLWGFLLSHLASPSSLFWAHS